MNSLKEPMMEEAMTLVQQEIQVEHEKYQREKRELQRLAKRQRDAALHNQSSREAIEGQYVLRYLSLLYMSPCLSLFLILTYS